MFDYHALDAAGSKLIWTFLRYGLGLIENIYDMLLVWNEVKNT